MNKYISKYGEPGEILQIRADQYLVERIIEKQAQRNKLVLGIRFWNDKVWAKEFRLQLKHVKYLLDKYSPEIILKALAHFRGKNIYSYGAKTFFEPLCDQIMKTETIRGESCDTMICDDIDVLQKPRKPFINNDLRNKLDG